MSTIRVSAGVRRLGCAFAAAACLTATPALVIGRQQAPRDTAPPPPSPQTLPGGASQVQETHGDWRVTCSQQNGQKVCTLSQQLADQSSRQLVLGIELKATTADKAEGTLVMPFGLAVDKPVSLQVDEGGPTLTRSFRTCVPVGCLVALTLDSANVTALRKGSALNVKATADGGKEAAFKLSLTGFGSALDRTAALSK
jgi:invasion protein IalB